MTYTPREPIAWRVFGMHRVYRFLDEAAQHAPDGPWATNGGRFDDGYRATLYVALAPEGAVAEFYRRNPELLAFQHKVRLRTYEFVLECIAEGCDVRTELQANAVGFPYERLRSSDRGDSDRYAECRELALQVEEESGVGIAFPSAAYDDAENLVMFHMHTPETWTTDDVHRVPTPRVDADSVRAIDF